MGEDYQTLTDIREKISLGFTVTEDDIREWMDDDSVFTTGDNVRSISGRARTWIWLVWIIPLGLLVGISFLGARRWTNKLIWGAAVLALASIIVIVAFGPLYSALAKPPINDALNEAVTQTEGLSGLVMDKVQSVAENTVDAFARGLMIQGIVLLVIALVVIGFAIFWNFYRPGGPPFPMVSARIASRWHPSCSW